MPENSSDIAELCREHEIAVELVESGESLEQVLDRALQECEQQLAKKGAPTRGGLRQLHGLIRLAHRARQNGDVSEDADPACVTDEGSEKLGGLFDELLVLCHKINNPLTSVLGRAQIMQLKLAGDSESPFVKPIRVVEESAKRVAALVRELANLLCVGRKVFVDRSMRDYDSSSPSDGR